MVALANSFVILATTLLGAVSQAAYATPVVEQRDIWVPDILYPHYQTVWYSGQIHNVTWDLSHKPADVSDPIGTITLRKGGIAQASEFVVAENFPLADGHVEVTVPGVLSGDDYQLVLIGDSGNVSPMFTILNQ
ncbi:hypothetical protein C8Q80DRAFT_1114968 [Daedaleopsis nitida]|nr:hypothetical protein C8Q80DRAFT_1114968 [Daedaleopsis nitida]